eukprot:4689723-Pleurochrysis_carterae.AAC.1
MGRIPRTRAHEPYLSPHTHQCEAARSSAPSFSDTHAHARTYSNSHAGDHMGRNCRLTKPLQERRFPRALCCAAFARARASALSFVGDKCEAQGER